MNIIVNKNWTDFKTEVTDRAMCPQWYVHIKGDPKPNEYRIYGKDGFLLFEVYLEQDGGDDVTDFEENYKSDWNAQLDHRDNNGVRKVHNSPRGKGKVTYFSGAGDDAEIGDGTRFLFNMINTDASKIIDLTYSENVSIKDAIIIFKGAPLGACICIDIVDPIEGIIGSYAKKIPILGSNRIDINSEDSIKITQGFIIRITVYNSDGTGEQESAANFKICGLLEMYRTNTV